MTCEVCTFEFCWLCRSRFTPDHFSTLRVSPCSGRLFTNNSHSISLCSRICTCFRNFLMLLFFPLIILPVLILMIPILKVLKEFLKIRKRYRIINQLHPRDNRFVNIEIKISLDNLGRCKLCGWAILSVIALPLTCLIFSIPVAVSLVIWVFAVAGRVYGTLCFIFASGICYLHQYIWTRNNQGVIIHQEGVPNAAPL